MSWKTVLALSLVFLLGNTSALDVHRIYRGTDADIRDYPHQVSLRVHGGYFHYCGGTIISDRHILTAAHCLVDLQYRPRRGISVRAGTSTTGSLLGNSYEVADFVAHPNFTTDSNNITGTNDIGVIELAEPITFNDRQKSIALPTKEPKNDTKGTIIGWGRTETGAPASTLKKLDVTLLTAENCQPLLLTKIYDTQICARHKVGYGACHGDSGGPMIVDGEVVGVTSWVENDVCADKYPDVYTNVYAYLDFINSYMNRNK